MASPQSRPASPAKADAPQPPAAAGAIGPSPVSRALAAELNAFMHAQNHLLTALRSLQEENAWLYRRIAELEAGGKNGKNG